MNKEEQWKKEAEIKLDELDDRGFDFDNWSISDAYERGYCDSAEPREKRITELEVTNKNISNECHKLVDSLEKKQNEVAELKEKNKWYSEQVCNKECAEVWENLTKAKEIIRTLLLVADNKISQMEFQLCVADAKQFISEVEK